MTSLGATHEYTLTTSDVEQIMRRRNDAKVMASANSVGNLGFMLHVGNDVSAGDKFPLIVTCVWDDGKVNGQVLLDGNDCLWVTSVKV